MTTGHETVEIELKCGVRELDVEIAPLVKWMDSFESVETYACCQGDEEIDPNDQHTMPYIFFSAAEDDLVSIVKGIPVISHVNTIFIEMGLDGGLPKRRPDLVYTLRFRDREVFEGIVREIRQKGKPPAFWHLFEEAFNNGELAVKPGEEKRGIRAGNLLKNLDDQRKNPSDLP